MNENAIKIYHACIKEFGTVQAIADAGGGNPKPIIRLSNGKGIGIKPARALAKRNKSYQPLLEEAERQFHSNRKNGNSAKAITKTDLAGASTYVRQLCGYV